MLKRTLLLSSFAFFCVLMAVANLPGGGTGTGANVTVTETSTTVTLKNGIVSVTINKASVNVTNYTYKNNNLLSGGYTGGKLYWTWTSPSLSGPGGSTYALTVNPTTNGGNYAEVRFRKVWDGKTTQMPIDVDIYFSLPRGAQGIYATATLTHPANYPTGNSGEWRMAGYVGSTFNWLSVDSLRNKQMPYMIDSGAAVSGAPKEVSRWLSGIYTGKYECKYDYSADFGTTDVWGWSSTTKNLGIWITAPSKEYYNGGPMKRELTCHDGPTILNMFNGGHYQMGGSFGADTGTFCQKTYGPFLVYCNSVPTGTTNAWKALWEDAKAQTKAEQSAWPYTWFKNSAYVSDSGRGTITGRLFINDTNTNVSVANNWVGIAKTESGDAASDFQQFGSVYQFWTKTDSAGYFTIPHVIADSGYNFYAFGPGSAGQLTKVNFVKVLPMSIMNLGDVIWTPLRVAPTVWEIGIPDRNATEFFHGNDWFTSNTYPDTNWGIFMNYPREFPNDVNYTVGTSNWATDWNFVQNYDKGVVYKNGSPVWKVNFNLTKAPTGVNAAVYVACAASFNAAIILNVNGVNVTTPKTGMIPPAASDAMIRKGIHGAFGDVRFTFPAKYLKAGANQISFSIRITGGAGDGDVMYDYLRLEAAGTSIVDILPVQFLPLQAIQKGNTAVLSWATVAEQNNSYFNVLKSTNGVDFSVIGKVAAVGNSTSKTNYGFTDATIQLGYNYYRIQQVDKDGKSTASNTVYINSNHPNLGLAIYPNPANNIITVDFETAYAETATCTFLDAKGSVILHQTIHTQIGKNHYQPNIIGLPRGSYWLNISSHGKTVSASFIKL